jgi:hypothetical protein
VGVGLLVFLIGRVVIKNQFSSERTALQATVSRNLRSLRQARYSSADLSEAEEQHEQLSTAVQVLARSLAFETRPRFRFDPSRDSTQYYVLHSEISREIANLANKARVVLPPGLDMEAPDTAQEERILRHLEALDVVDRVLRLAIEARVDRVHSIRVRLDSSLGARGGPGEIETTDVEIDLRGRAAPIVRTLALTQSDRHGKPLTIGKLEMVGARSKQDEVGAKVTFQVVRLHGELLEQALTEDGIVAGGAQR